jgi:predicted dehydrogenase
MSNHLILLVGAGPMALAHAQVLKALGCSVLCVSRRSESAERFCRETGLRAVAGGLQSWIGRTDRPAVDGAVVAVSLPELAQVTHSLIAAGIKKILVEKPAGLTASEIERVAEAGQAADAAIYLAYNRRFYASVAMARRMITEDGGVSSFFFDFTELASRTAIPGRGLDILHNWFLANSSHVVDLAFHLGGRPKVIEARVKGCLDWHPAGATFAGSGETLNGAVFVYLADWAAPGRWGVEFRTAKRRLILQPLETLKVQVADGFSLTDIPLDDLDTRFKPGLYRQMEAFLSDRPEATVLQPLPEHARAVREDYLPLIGGVL